MERKGIMTTHEFDVYCDTLQHQEPPYHEQLLVMQEFERARDAALKQQGAKKALTELNRYLMYSAIQDGMGDTLMGLKWAIDAIDRQVATLVPEGGVA
jgi:hypothetical protein